MSGLEFTEEAARQLESLYLTKDIVTQRAETLKQLCLCPGERVLDVGCGPGFLCESMAEVVGVRDFVGRKKELPTEDLQEWYDEFARLSEVDRYFFSSNRHIFRASNPST